MISGVEPFEALAESCEAIVFITDASMRMLYASTALEKQTGFTAADFQFPQADNPFIHREDAERVAATLAAFATSDARVSPPIENRFLDRWGRTHHYRSTVTKIVYRGEPAMLFVCHAADDRAAPTSDDRQYRALVESADDAIVRVDNAGRFLFANRRTLELLGYTAVELGALRLDELSNGTSRVALTDALARSLGSRQAIRFELALLDRSGAAVPCHAVLTSLTSFGHPGELLAILRPTSSATAR